MAPMALQRSLMHCGFSRSATQSRPVQAFTKGLFPTAATQVKSVSQVIQHDSATDGRQMFTKILFSGVTAGIGSLLAVALTPTAADAAKAPPVASVDPTAVVSTSYSVTTTPISATEVAAHAAGGSASPAMAKALAAAADSCKEISVRGTATASGGVTAFWSEIRADWCYNGSTITYRYRFPEKHYANGYLFYYDDGLDENVSPGPPYRYDSTRSFKHCAAVPWGPLCNEKYVDLGLYMRANGTYYTTQDIR